MSWSYFNHILSCMLFYVLFLIEGLFMGMSILSLVEVAYYFTLRFTCNLKQQRKNEKENKVFNFSSERENVQR